MNRIILSSLLFLLPCTALRLCAQLPDTEIFLAEMHQENGKWVFGEAENITKRIGYDNQPAFSPGDKSILFVQVSDSVQSDVAEYILKDKSRRIITGTKESEYSPNFTPDKSGISVVRVDLDSAQRFYILDPQDKSKSKLIEGGDSVGYYSWLNDSLVAMFIVGEKSSLEILNIHSHKRHFIQYDIGRCMKLSPDKRLLYFMDKSDSVNWNICALNISDFHTKPVVPALKGSEDFCPLPDGSLIMGAEGILYRCRMDQSPEWEPVKDYSKSVGPFYRISVNESGTMIAIVTYAGKKP